MNKLERLKERKKQLENSIEFTKQKKKEIIEFVQSLTSELSSGKITKKEYEEELKKALKNRTAEQWINYYDDYVQYYKYQVKLCEKLIKKESSVLREKRIKESFDNVKQRSVPILSFLIVFVFIGIFISLFFILKPLGNKAFSKIGEKISTGLEYLKEKAPEEAEKIPTAPEKIFEEPKIPVNLEDKQARISEESLMQYQAVVGKPVKWKKQFVVEGLAGFNVELPEEAENVKVKSQGKDITEIANIGEKWVGRKIKVELKNSRVARQAIEENFNPVSYEIEYETPAPVAEEKNLEENLRAIKRILITGPDDVHYENILSFTKLPRELKKEEIKKLRLYEVRENERILTKFTAYDTNENSLLDYIEWIADSSSVYELIIEISHAEHLDENRDFISDIYEQVKALDGNWSEIINENEYVRVTFKIPLDNTRDITIYPKVITGNPQIEVYEFEGEELIAIFEDIKNNNYNKVFLTKLQGEQDVFDLKIINGAIEIDYIVDPTETLNPIVHINTELKSVDLTPAEVDYITNDDSNNILITKGNLLTAELSDVPQIATLNDVDCSLTYYTDSGFPNQGSFSVYDSFGGNLIDTITITESLTDNTISLLDLQTKNLQASQLNTMVIRVENTILKKPYYIYVDKIGCVVDYAPANQPPQITYIEPISDQMPIENDITAIIFEVQATDVDGFADITSVDAEFSKTDEATRTGTCSFQTNIGTDIGVYSCSVDMQYYDGAGIWDIRITATDSVSNLAEDTSQTFTYLPLTAITISPATLNWPTISQGDTNQIPGSSTTVTNTGNYEGAIVIRATNPYGEARTTEFIPAESFVADTDSGTDACDGTYLQDNADATIAGSMLNKGPGQQEEIFYCIPSVPLVSSQTYSTQTGSWTISLLLVAITITRKKKEKKAKKKQINSIKEDNLTNSLNLIAKELKQKYSPEKQKIIKLLINEIKKKHKLNNKQISELMQIRKQVKIPTNIFSKKLGGLEAVTKYMKENLTMSYHEIAEILNRDDRTIWTAYNKSKEKYKGKLQTKSKILISISVFQNRKLTILESLTIYFKQKGLKYKEIAILLNRDQRNIWTTYSRAKKKSLKKGAT